MDGAVTELLFIEWLNAVRARPALEAQRLGVVLEDGDGARSPVAPVVFLRDLAHRHSEAMVREQRFSHQEADGKDPLQRAVEAGFPVTGSWAFGEVLSLQGVGADVLVRHQDALFRSPAHRKILLDPEMREIGVGVVEGEIEGQVVSLLTGVVAARGDTRYLFGVVFDDKNQNQKYDDGEGMQGQILHFLGENVVTTQAGAYFFSFRDGARGDLVFQNLSLPVVVSSENVQVSFRARPEKWEPLFGSVERKKKDSRVCQGKVGTAFPEKTNSNKEF